MHVQNAIIAIVVYSAFFSHSCSLDSLTKKSAATSKWNTLVAYTYDNYEAMKMGF